ncbi:MAG: hypothetical protein OXN90_19445 [Gemmatimonadota bacterium]|nr:hypothetical protein [Gemmatimonadota bacterium]
MFGYTGDYVARSLLDQGVHVRTLSRQTGGTSPLDGLVEEAPSTS